MKIKQKEIRKARIEIIPMIDAIFFLLVFFMFSSLSMVRLSGTNVSLPAKASAMTSAKRTPATRDNKVVVSVARDGQVFVGKNRVATDGLRQALQTRFAGNKDAIVIVNIDKRQKTQKLIDTIDSINQVSLPAGRRPTVLIATEPVNPSTTSR